MTEKVCIFATAFLLGTLVGGFAASGGFGVELDIPEPKACKNCNKKGGDEK